MPKEITFDKFIRWAGVALIVFAVLYITNYLSEVLLPFVIAWFSHTCSIRSEVYREQTPHQGSCPVHHPGNGCSHRCRRWRTVAHHTTYD